VIFGKVHREYGGNIKVFISGGAKLDEGISATIVRWVF
jgi:long-subunit acyl-CoA synthetase (AMP-forming)